jgi:4a-hydroxytetrahydrobiopterin dehydratase
MTCADIPKGTAAATPEETTAQLEHLPGWYTTHDGQRIRKDWTTKNFIAGLDFFNKVGDVAEAENHHPDLHIEGYRNVSIEMWTHSIGGISVNDFILAAKINQVPIELKS